MKAQIQDFVRQVLNTNHFGVLATESENKPHACFIAITASDNLGQIFFATFRNTRKYTNLIQNENVCMLFEYRKENNLNQQDSTILTTFGKAKELDLANSEAIVQGHLLQHPDLTSFLAATDCALFELSVDAYQVVLGVEDIFWWKLKNDE
ncbi:MAG: pyridoxamine 5'-phosphate oxidase family protein [Paludibacteraceae bacterium]|nr:pyridoxamine 5'-phosphate oxidase family protein [Paludibacteraceae bacterium]MBN2788546.1 pyridoxamine 5'-phosphate oxidase family protein [Paludibacteraceae bacterium]